MKSGIYLIVNLITNKLYVGSAVNLNKRLLKHRSSLRLGNHDNKYLQNAWNIDGEENFIFLILEEVENEFLLETEQYWIDAFESCNREIGYNLCPIAGSQLGRKMSEETKAKLRSHKRTKEQLERMSISQRGKKMPIQTRIGIRNSRLGKPSGNRKIDKWPHADGNRCKCLECRAKINLNMKRYKQTYFAKKNMEREMCYG